MIGLIVGIFTYNFGPAEGVARGIIAVVWIIALSGLGFCLGVMSGWYIQDRNN